MTYERLADFVKNRMRMSHVYQPVMLMTLLRAGGASSIEEISRSILAHDESQVEYYEKVTKNMAGRVLGSHGIVEKDKAGYSLVGYEDLDAQQIEHLTEMCESKLEEYKERRIWQHRRASAGYVPGTARYEVLSSAPGPAASCAGCLRTSGRLRSTTSCPVPGAAPTTLTTCKPSATAATRQNATGTRPTSGR